MTRKTLRAVLLASLLLTAWGAGCMDDGDSGDDGAGNGARAEAYTAFERVALPFNVTGTWSQTLVPGPYAILPGIGHFVDVELPLTEGGAALLPEGARVHLGLFLPDVPEGTKVPVIADVGPYYRSTSGVLAMQDPTDPNGGPINQPEGDLPATQPANRLGRFLIENFVPHGFAVAQVSVLGSGDSNHCFDMFGMAEQLGVDAAVTWLGEQGWSNGNVGLIGRSYDGSTPWMAATFGNPHLKTIVPISGLHGLQALVTRNGTSEARVATFQNVVYGQFGLDGDAGDAQHATCPDWLTAAPMGAAALLTGDEVLPIDEGYWREREFLPRTLANYEGSVYFIHGLQDWNVDPHLVSPAFHQLRDKGLDVKGLFGQWAHMYPDRPGEHENLPDGLGGTAYPFTVRYDWAEDLLEWFTFYLKGEGPQPVLKVEVQDNIGRWRVEDTYPPTDALELPLEIEGPVAQVSPSSSYTYDLRPISEEAPTVLSGHMYLHAAVTPNGANGQIHYTVRDATSGLRLAFGTMDLRHRGGEESPIVPQQDLVVRVQSQPFEFVLPAGHGLQLVIAQTGDGILPQPTAAPFTFDPAASELRMPVVERGVDVYFQPPAWDGTAQATPPQP